MGKDCHSEISIEKEDSFHQLIGLECKEGTNEMLHAKCSLYDAETCKLRNIDQKYLESTEMLCWRRKEK